MDLMVCDVTENIDAQAETKLVGILEQLGLDFKIIECCGSRKICINNMNYDDEDCNRPCCSSDIIVQTSNKDECRIRQCDIIYIAIENRKSAVYVDGKRIESNYSLEHWKEILNPKIFAQPHYSYLVNLNYVTKVTKDFVTLRYGEVEYKVYTSSRKLCAFKKAVLEFYETKVNK